MSSPQNQSMDYGGGQPSDAGPVGPASLLGAQESQQQAMATQAAQMEQVVSVVGAIEQELLALSRAFPIATPSIRAAIEAVRMALQQIVSNPTQPEPPGPRVLA